MPSWGSLARDDSSGLPACIIWPVKNWEPQTSTKMEAGLHQTYLDFVPHLCPLLEKKIAPSIWQTVSVLLSVGWGCRPGCPALVTALDKGQCVTKASPRGFSLETWALQCTETRMNGMLSADELPTSSSDMAPWSSLWSCFFYAPIHPMFLWFDGFSNISPLNSTLVGVSRSWFLLLAMKESWLI